MKWPKALVLIRHDVSAYNAMKDAKRQNPQYAEFTAEFERDPEGRRCQRLARLIHKRYALGVGDHDTPLAPNQATQRKAAALGTKMRQDSLFGCPDVIFVSPYLRARDTLAWIVRGWPELARVRAVEEERIREQDHGLALLYNDWQVFQALHPEQRRLRELEGPYWYRFPQGENVPDVRLRNHSWLGALVRDFAGQTVWAVTHHLNILATRANLERWSAEDFDACDRRDKPANCGVTLYRGNPRAGRDGRLELEFYNRSFV